MKIARLPGFSCIDFLFQQLIFLLQQLQVGCEFLCTNDTSEFVRCAVNQYNFKTELQHESLDLSPPSEEHIGRSNSSTLFCLQPMTVLPPMTILPSQCLR